LLRITFWEQRHVTAGADQPERLVANFVLETSRRCLDRGQ
jgi:hypothetical protein